MTLTTISIITATAIYIAYNAICLALFSIPESLSNTYYLWKEKCNKGWLFPLMMCLVVALMMPAWISLSEGSNFQFLAFLAPASLMFVGTAPRFKDFELENKVHTYSAIIAAACSLLWVVLVTPYGWQYRYMSFSRVLRHFSLRLTRLALFIGWSKWLFFRHSQQQ